MPRPKVMTTGDVARMFRVSARTIRLWGDRGKLGPMMRTLGNHRRFSVDHVREAYRNSFKGDAPEHWPPRKSM